MAATINITGNIINSMQTKMGASLMLSAIVLVGITVVLGLITSEFVSKVSKERAAQVKNITKERLDCQFTNLYIRNATLNCNNNCSSGISHTISVTIVNSGTKPVQIDNIYVSNTTGSLFTFYANGTKVLNASDVTTLSNTSTAACGGMNRTIDRVRVISNNCPTTAFDSLPGSDVAFQNCG